MVNGPWLIPHGLGPGAAAGGWVGGVGGAGWGGSAAAPGAGDLSWP